MKEPELIEIFEGIVQHIEDGQLSVPDKGLLYYLNVMRAFARESTAEPRTDAFLAMFYCYLKMKECEASMKQ